MKLEEFLLGPFAARDRDFWVKWNYAHEAKVLYRNVVVAFKEGRVLKEPPPRLKELLKCENGVCRTCIFHFNVVTGEWDVKAPVWALKDVTDMAASDALFDGFAERCVENGLAPTVIDKIQVDFDLPAEHPSPKARDWWARLTPLDRAVHVARRVKRVLIEHGINPAFIFSGSKGFHILLVPEEPLPASWRSKIISALAEIVVKRAVPWLNADENAADVKRKMRIPGTVNTETGQYARAFDPDTGEFVEFQWPKPTSKIAIGWLMRLYDALNKSVQATKPTPQVQKRRGGAPGKWLEVLRELFAGKKLVDCRERLASFIGSQCAADGIPLEECIKIAKEFGIEGTEYEKALAYRYQLVAEGRLKPLSLKKLLSGDAGEVWYAIKPEECVQ